MYTIDNIASNVFEFEVKEGKKTRKYAVPTLDSLSVSRLFQINEARANSAEDEVGMALSKIIKEIFDEAAPGLLDTLTYSQFTDLASAWMAYSEVDAGE